MPIYEYQCTSCHHLFDLIQKINDQPEKTCPKCSKNTAIKLISAAGFQLKGTGWYATDFKNKGSAKQASPQQEKGSGADGSPAQTSGDSAKSSASKASAKGGTE